MSEAWSRVDKMAEELNECRAAISGLMRQFHDLSDAHSRQAGLLGALLTKLGESADSLPGEQAPERSARRRAN